MTPKNYAENSWNGNVNRILKRKLVSITVTPKINFCPTKQISTALVNRF